MDLKIKKMKDSFKKIIHSIWQDKKSRNLAVFAIAMVLFVIVGATYAYFSGSLSEGTDATINATTGTTDSLSFSVGKDINIHASVDNFYEGHENLKGDTTATATLKANNVTNQATGKYNVFFIIDNNDFEYSTEDGQAELVMKITDPHGNEVMEIAGLKRVDGGFDITTRTGGFLIISDYDIEVTPDKALEAQTWKLEVTLVNLSTDQNKNKGKSLNGRFYITTEKISTYELAEIRTLNADATYNTITANLDIIAGSSEIDKYYFAIEKANESLAFLESSNKVLKLQNKVALSDGEYKESNEASYIFKDLTPNTKYKIYSYVVDKNKIKSNVYETEVTTGDYSIPIIDSVTTSNTTNSITVNVNSRKGSEEISKYYYSIDDGTLIESTEASHTFNDLAENTTYTIKVKAVDVNGNESNVYTVTAKTVLLASISNITTSATSSSITVNVTASKGDANIASYYYSIDNGVTWSEATPNSSYTFNDLDSNTTYQIKVKVVDTEGRESGEAVVTAKTDYVLASITDVTHSTTLNSITVNVTAQAGSNKIVKYYYSKDNGSTYEESDNSSHTFSDLLDTTEYKIKIKVKDSDGRYSTEYYESISTVTYNKPSITNVNVTAKTYNSISLTTTATKGTNNVANYYYKVGTGAWSTAQTTNTYTITDLTEDTNYMIYVKVEDIAGRYSNEYELEVTTNAYDLPSISSVVATETINSISLNVTASGGDGTISLYHYSKDNGSTWFTSTDSTYVFSQLTSGVTFYLSVKVEDSNGRFSTEYKLTKDTINTLKAVSENYTGEIWGQKDKITKVVFEDSLVSHSNAVQTYDVSASGNGDIKAYLVSSGTNTYTAYIQSNGRIIANPNSSYLFYNFVNLTSIEGFSKLDTSNVEDMSYMFAADAEAEKNMALTSLDLSSFNTSKVKNMHKMFWNADDITNLNLSSFNTANVEDMYGMFGGYDVVMSFTSIIFGTNWNTAKVTDMRGMFQNCGNLKTIDLSRFDTSQVTDMSYMFNNCVGLTSLDVSKFNTAKVINMTSMFSECNKLTILNVSNFNTANVEAMSGMFSGCSSLTSLNVSNFNTSKVKTMKQIFYKCVGLTSLDVSNFNTANVEDMSAMFAGCNGLSSLNVSNFNTAKVTDMSFMFSGESSDMSLSSITFGTNWKTNNVTNMKAMFQYCSNLITLDLSKFVTSQVTNMAYMFSNCKKINTLDVSKFNTAKVTDMRQMFANCYAVQALNVSNFNTANVTDMHSMFINCYLISALTLNSFDTTKVTDMGYMFSGCGSLTSLNLSNFNTSKVTDMAAMFNECAGLTSLNVSSFNTSNVESMRGMFSDCSALASLDLSSFRTPKVTTMRIMFHNCSTLTSLNLSTFDTTKVTDMYAMFFECENLGTLNLSSFVTPLVETMYAMFYKCSSLTNLNISKLNTSNVKDMAHMFNGCSSIENLDLSHFNTANVEDMGYLFNDCIKLATLNISNFNTSKVTTMERMFKACSSLGSLSLTNFVTSKVDNMSYMFAGCSALTNLNVSSFNTAKVTDMSGMFSECSALTSLSVTNFNTSLVNNMAGMFNACSGLTSLDVSKFNTVNVENMYAMFTACSSLTALSLSNFDTSKVTNMKQMFYDCRKISTLDLSSFNTSKVTDMMAMFSGDTYYMAFSSITFGAKWDTSKVTTMAMMFQYCNKLTNLNLSMFSTPLLTDTRYMFNLCSQLNTLNIKNMDFTNVSQSTSMFNGASSTISVTVRNQTAKTFVESALGTGVGTVVIG